MRIIGFNFMKIAGKREVEAIPKVKVNHNIELVDITQEKVDVLKSDSVLKFSFKYSILYEPKIASIDFEGFVLIMMDAEKIKQIQKDWKKKIISDELRLVLFNLIMNRCNVRALQISDELSLPPHIPMPRFNLPQEKKQEKAEYTG